MFPIVFSLLLLLFFNLLETPTIISLTAEATTTTTREPTIVPKPTATESLNTMSIPGKSLLYAQLHQMNSFKLFY